MVQKRFLLLVLFLVSVPLAVPSLSTASITTIWTPPANTQEWHPGPRATCPICRRRAADDIKERIKEDGKDPRTISPGELKVYIEEVRGLGRYDQELTITPRGLRSYGVGVNPPSANRVFIERLNAENPDTFLTVELASSSRTGKAPLYTVYADKGQPLYSGSDVRTLVIKINERIKDSDVSTVYIIPKGLTKQKGDAFLSSARIQMKQVNPNISVLPLETRTGSVRFREMFFSTEARLVRGSITEPTEVTAGRFKGFYTSSVQVAKAGQRGVLKVFAKSKEVINRFLSSLRSRMSGDLANRSPAQIINKARAEFKRTYGLSDEDILIMYQDEFGQTILVRIPGGHLSTVG